MVSTSASPRSGVYYFSQGWKLIGLPGIRRLFFCPAGQHYSDGRRSLWLFTLELDPSLMSHVPDWHSGYLLWPVAVISVLLVFGYFFSTIANWIAAPFNAACWRKAGSAPDRRTRRTGVFGIMKDIPRIMKREWQKFAVPAPRAPCCYLFMPGIGQTVAPVLWFLFSAWMLAIQYCDYPFDNHKVPFKRCAGAAHKVTNMQFGALTSLFTMIPVLNLVIMPVAICGAAMWVVVTALLSTRYGNNAKMCKAGVAYAALIPY
jgi:CysZ protein